MNPHKIQDNFPLKKVGKQHGKEPIELLSVIHIFSNESLSRKIFPWLLYKSDRYNNKHSRLLIQRWL